MNGQRALQAHESIGVFDAVAARASPLPQIRCCPTSGISLASAPDFLALPNVACVGGSWQDKPEACDWAGVTQLARGGRAAPLTRQRPR